MMGYVLHKKDFVYARTKLLFFLSRARPHLYNLSAALKNINENLNARKINTNCLRLASSADPLCGLRVGGTDGRVHM